MHYLGSKLRIVEPIVRAVDDLNPRDGKVCDLFAGSGTVSLALARSREVVASDIQEYSRVLCSAILNPAELAESDIDEIIFKIAGKSKHRRLLEIAQPLVQHERDSIGAAEGGQPSALFDIIEHGALVSLGLGLGGHKAGALGKLLRRFDHQLKKYRLRNHASTLMSRYYGGVYFSYEQAIQLDAILEGIESVDEPLRTTLLAAAISTASEIVNTVGRQFAQPLRPRSAAGAPKMHLVRKAVSDRMVDCMTVYRRWLSRYATLRRSGRKHLVLREDFRETLKILPPGVSVVYADPPYTRDHYSRYYHVLETMCLRDNPIISTVTNSGETFLSRGIYRSERHQSPFCIKTQVEGAFDELFRGVRAIGSGLVLSYSPFDSKSAARPRLLGVSALEALAKRYFPNIEVRPIGEIAHSKLGDSRYDARSDGSAEILLLCQ